MNNKKLGNSFEKEICEYFEDKGFWVHFITPDKRGAQPFDIIAVKNGIAHAVECKTLADSKKYFDISRIEQNQQLAFEKWMDCGNDTPLIAIKHRGHIKFINWTFLKKIKKVDMNAYE